MSVNRREFIVGGAAAAWCLASSRATGAAAAGAATGAAAPKREAAFKISSQPGVIPGKSLEDRIATMAKWGFDGVEPGGDIVGNEGKYLAALKGTKLKVSAICWGSAGGSLVSDDPKRRAEGQEAMKRVLTAAGAVGSTGVIFVPAFNHETKLANQEIRKILVDTLPALGEHAVKAGTRILLEPLNRGEAFFLRLLADAAAICRDAKNPGVCMMGDFYHMGIEETSDLGAFISAGDYLHHVHLASRARNLPGQDERSFIDGFRGLKMIGFQDYLSFECGVRGNRDVEIPKSVAFLREQWNQA